MKRDWWNKEFRKVVALGESTTAGGWASSQECCWASRLVALINSVQSAPAELFNAGIGANLISSRSPYYERSGKPAANERLEQHVVAQKPDLLVISYGINDARGGTSQWLFAEEMERIINQIRRGIEPLMVLLGPYMNTRFDVDWTRGSLESFHVYNDVTAIVAQLHECLYVDLLATYDNADWLVHFDGVHANDLGHLVVANKIFEVLAQNCSGLSKYTKERENEIRSWRDESSLAADYGYEKGALNAPRKER